MPRPFPDKYTDQQTLLEDGSVSFVCSQDKSVWPWLKLNAIHPILVQTINFWASIDSGEFIGTFDPEVWTALTQVDWICGEPDVGIPARGLYEKVQQDKRSRFKLTFYDHADRLVASLNGQGVSFRTRNFEGWRDEAKEKIVKPEPPTFDYAAKDAVGVQSDLESFLAPLSKGETIATTGLITKQNGLRPAHPYIGGSGDHVNSTHMGEIGRQFGELLLGQPLRNTGGEMVFSHYVELGTPFTVDLTAHSKADRTFQLLVRQAERDCTTISMTYALTV